MREVDIFADLTDTEMEKMAAAAPRKDVRTGDMVYTPGNREEALYIVKAGRIRIFRVTDDGKALTTAILTPGMVFGEMPLVGQRMHGSYAEALDASTLCAMNTQEVRAMLLGDPRIAARIAATLGERVAELEQRLSDSVFKTVPQRLASTLLLLASSHSKRPVTGAIQLSITHEQLATVAGTSRETVTKVLGELADAGSIKLGRGKIVLLDLGALTAAS